MEVKQAQNSFVPAQGAANPGQVCGSAAGGCGVQRKEFRPEHKWGEGGEQEQAQRETSQAPKRGGRGFTRTVVLQEQRSDVLQKPSRPTLPVRTYGTKEHLALEPGQTLAPRRPPPQPPIHRQVDSTRGYQGNGAFLPPTLCLVTCQRALPGSVARCQQCKKRLDRNRHPLSKNPLLHTRGRVGNVVPTTHPFSHHLAEHTAGLRGKRRRQGGKKGKPLRDICLISGKSGSR